MDREHSKRPHATKSGPGRYHQDGRKSPKPPKPAGAWAGQHKASPEKRERRQAIRAIGRRQYLKVTKAADAIRAITA